MKQDLLEKLVDKSITKEELTTKVKENFDLLPEILNGVSSEKAPIRYGCAKVLMHLYRGPIRPINPAAVADFVAYQMGEKPQKPKSRKYASLKPVNVALKFMRTVVSADNVWEFISVIKKEGLFTALDRSFTYVKSVRGRLRPGRHPGYPPYSEKN